MGIISIFLGCGGSSQLSDLRALRNGIAPKYTVHQDHVDPRHVEQFVRSRLDWLKTLSVAQVHDDRGTFLQLDSNIFFTLHPIRDYGDIDRIRTGRRKALGNIPESAFALYDSTSDHVLIPPHRSEVWSHGPELDYIADSALTPIRFGAATIVIEEIPPSPAVSSKYYEAWVKIRKALETAMYPLTCICFFSTYGEGRYISLWLARSEAQLVQAPSLEDAVASVVGTAEAKELLATLESTISARIKYAARIRHDMSDYAE